VTSGDAYPSHAPEDAGLADAAADAVARFVSEWVARGVAAEKAIDAVSAAAVQVRRGNRPPPGDDLAERVRAVVESGGLPPPEPEDDILGGTDLDPVNPAGGV